MSVTKHASFRLSATARGLLLKLAKHLGLSQTAVIEWMVRREARRLLK